MNRNYPQFWEGSQYKVASSAFGVKLILTADIYQKSMRLAKYSVMFLIFTFAAFFFSEIINKKRVHPIQYVLIGMAILIFYTLVLSLSEHMQFNYALNMGSIRLFIILATVMYITRKIDWYEVETIIEGNESETGERT